MRVMSIGLRLGECMILSAGWYNLMDLAACLPRSAERLDTRYQWIKRLLANARGQRRSDGPLWAGGSDASFGAPSEDHPAH